MQFIHSRGFVFIGIALILVLVGSGCPASTNEETIDSMKPIERPADLVLWRAADAIESPEPLPSDIIFDSIVHEIREFDDERPRQFLAVLADALRRAQYVSEAPGFEGSSTAYIYETNIRFPGETSDYLQRIRVWFDQNGVANLDFLN